MSTPNSNPLTFEHYEGPDAPRVDRRTAPYVRPAVSANRPYQCQYCTSSFDRPSSLHQVPIPTLPEVEIDQEC